MNKVDEEELIKYRNLSDGEHQLMHVLGSIILLDTSGSILLYDEPETHFNPEWRSQLITLINKATEEKKKHNQALGLTVGNALVKYKEKLSTVVGKELDPAPVIANVDHIILKLR